VLSTASRAIISPGEYVNWVLDRRSDDATAVEITTAGMVSVTYRLRFQNLSVIRNPPKMAYQVHITTAGDYL